MRPRRAGQQVARDASNAGRAVEQPSTVVLTVGHSTRPLEAFTELLRSHTVTRLVDVRTVPRSRHNPQFNRDTLPDTLRAVGIDYVHLPGLGGLRHPKPDSANTGWRNASFRGFADHMQTPEFAASLAQLIESATHGRVAIMCAEAVPWRCHRSLIGDALLARGVRVEHIQGPTRCSPHRLTPWATVTGTRVAYPSAAVSAPPPAPPTTTQTAAAHPRRPARAARKTR